MTSALQTTTDSANLRVQSTCFVCGRDNSRGLQIHFELGSDGAITAEWTPTSEWEGFQGIVHGGVVSTVLDEAMSKAVAAARCDALTGELRVRFRRTVRAGEPVRIRGWIAARRKRLVETEATLTDSEGNEHAHAWAAFMVLKQPLGSSSPNRPEDSGRITNR